MATTITKSFNAVTIQELVIRPVLLTDANGNPIANNDSGGNPIFKTEVLYFVTGPSGEKLSRHGPVALTAAQQLTLDTFVAAKAAALATIEGVA